MPLFIIVTITPIDSLAYVWDDNVKYACKVILKHLTDELNEIYSIFLKYYQHAIERLRLFIIF